MKERERQRGIRIRKLNDHRLQDRGFVGRLKPTKEKREKANILRLMAFGHFADLFFALRRAVSTIPDGALSSGHRSGKTCSKSGVRTRQAAERLARLTQRKSQCSNFAR